MFCKRCGKEVRDGIKFCGGCGEKVENISQGKIYNMNNNVKKKKSKLISIIIGVFSLIVILGLIGIFVVDNEYISKVKNGTFNKYPDVIIGEAFDDFFGSPKWRYFISDDDLNIVEFTGKCTYDDVEVEALLQFTVYDDDSFELSYFSMNDISQNLLMISELIDKVAGE